MSKLIPLTLALTFLCCFRCVYAGNHEVIHPTNGNSIGWDNSTEIPYWTDTGPLGELTNLQARVLLESMMDVWTSVETAKVGFVYQGNLPEDVTEGNFDDYLAMTSCGKSNRVDIPKDVVPIIFDSDGKILEYIAGEGSAEDLGGLATLRCFVGSSSNPESIYQGMVIINGRFIDGKGSDDGSPEDLSINGVAGVILHEVGHLIGLDHSALNEEIYDSISSGVMSSDNSRYLPVMLPTVLRGSAAFTTLRPDDIAAVSTLYPADGYLSSVGDIGGEIKRADGEEVRKVNVIARKVEDPLCEAVSALSGRRCVPLVNAAGKEDFNSMMCDSSDLMGDYLIEGLTPGSYTVEVENLESGWIRDEMFPSSLDQDLPGDAEFYNSDDRSDDGSPYEYTVVEVGENRTTSNVDVVLGAYNGNPGALERIPISEFESGAGTRCNVDAVDYSEVLDDVDAGLSSLLDKPASAAKKAAGCGLISRSSGKGFEIIGVVLLCSLLAILRGGYMRRKIGTMLIVLGILFISVPGMASSIIPSDLSKMSRKAGKIFYGKCVDVRVVPDERGILSTFVTYEVARAVKGTKDSTVTFKVFGAAGDSSGSQPSTLVGINHFYPGRKDILFLYKESPWGFTTPIGLWQGDFPVVETKAGPRVLKASASYNNTFSVGVKTSMTPDSKMPSPDDFLDEVEEFLK